MKIKPSSRLLLALTAAAAILAFDAQSQDQALFINVDVTAKTYSVSGSLTATPALFNGVPVLSWNNGVPLEGSVAQLLSAEAFDAAGNTIQSHAMYIRSGGNLHGGFHFLHDGITTITANPCVIYDYSDWDPPVAAELERKAAEQEGIPLAFGSPYIPLTLRLAEVRECPPPVSWSGFLPPVRDDGTTVFKAGRVVPLRFQLTGDSAAITDLEVRLYFAGGAGMWEAISVGGAVDGNLFRFDSSNNLYQFNWNTKGLVPGVYELALDFGDGLVHGVTVTIR